MSALPDKDWLWPQDLAPYFDVSIDTVNRSMGLPFTQITKKLKAVHIEDLKKWELARRGIIGVSSSNEEEFDIPRRSPPDQKRSNTKRQLLSGTSTGELANLLNTRSQKHS